MRNVYDVPEQLHSKYRGAGYAIGVTHNGVLIDIKYLTAISLDFEIDSELEDAKTRLEEIINDPRLGEVVVDMNKHGLVHIGMLSCYQFVEL